jgi:hypothetical protein
MHVFSDEESLPGTRGPQFKPEIDDTLNTGIHRGIKVRSAIHSCHQQYSRRRAADHHLA